GVAARVDARHHRLGRLAEATEPAGQHAQRRGPVDADHVDALKAGNLSPLDVNVLVDVEAPDGGPAAGPIVEGCGHDDLVAGLVEGSGQRMQPGRVDTVIVG